LTLSPGTRLGVYEVTSQIGEGGMGQVFRAHDTKLNRDVALKVLPDSFARDTGRLARFTREAQTLASLNHPNIAHIHGLEESGGVRALVMELVEGEDLSQRIARGAVPIEEALAIAKQIAEALDAAHEKGIVHRDLKPANIKITPDGTVKVLDFGLAKIATPGGNLTQSPTITAMATREGVILGTPLYMSPEQARGNEVDKRADIWAFGCVLYELLTGARAFPGDTTTDVLAAVVNRPPDFKALPPAMPPSIRRVLARCLNKDPKRRLRDIGDARVEIEDVLNGAAEESVAPLSPHALRVRHRALAWSVTGALGVGVGVALVLLVWSPWRIAPPFASVRLSADLGADASLVTNEGASAILSPDGQVLAFVAQKNANEPSQLYVRPLNELLATPLSGTGGAISPFFSPDGEWIAFFADGKLKKISVAAHSVVTLCDAPNGRGGFWADDGTIAFSPDYSQVRLMRVSSDGGAPEPLTNDADGFQRWPQVLPGGKAVLYTGGFVAGGFNNANLIVQPLPDGERKVVQRNAHYGRYLSSGHLVYVHEGALFAAPFDLDRFEITGPAVRALEAVTANATVTGGAQFAVSGTGTLVYLPGARVERDLPISWMDREGKTTPLHGSPADWLDPVFSPDGRQLAMAILDRGQRDVWIYDWMRDARSRLTLDPANDEAPVWTPDGRRIAFASQRGDGAIYNLYLQRADGIGQAQRLTESRKTQFPGSWHPTGKFLAFTEEGGPRTDDHHIMMLPMNGDEATGWTAGEPTVFLRTPANEGAPMFSPDGRWLAYSSNESGRYEVYVRPFPGLGGKWQISTGGTTPIWSPSRRELFYSTGDRRIMVASYTIEGDSFRAEKPRLWAERRFMQRINAIAPRSFGLHPDGDRFALAASLESDVSAKQNKVVFIFNFFDELRRIAPATKRQTRGSRTNSVSVEFVALLGAVERARSTHQVAPGGFWRHQ
jgi:serine/threonine-protein kinase